MAALLLALGLGLVTSAVAADPPISTIVGDAIHPGPALALVANARAVYIDNKDLETGLVFQELVLVSCAGRKCTSVRDFPFENSRRGMRTTVSAK